MLRKQLKVVAIAGVVMAVALSGITLLGYKQFSALKAESELSTVLNSGLNDLQYLATEYLVTRTPRALKQWKTRHERLGTFIANAEIADDDVRRLMPEIIMRFEILGSVFSKLVHVGGADLSPERADAAERAIVTRLLTQVLALSHLKDRIAEIYQARESRIVDRVPLFLASAFLIGVLIMVALYYHVLRRLSINAEQLSASIVSLGDGNFDVPISTSADSNFVPLFQALEQTRERLADAIAKGEAERADLDHFVYVASHDFKAPLRGIDNLASWIEEDAGHRMGADAQEHLRLLRRRVLRLENLLEDLLAYSRAGRAQVPPETVDVGELVTSVVSDLGLPEGLVVKVAANLPTITSPKTPLAHIFFNLISNAAKHHDRPDGLIEVSGEKDGIGGYRFRVTDDGPGIPERFHQRIFEMFQTLQPRDVVEGSGMGLAIARRLVHRYNGELTVFSGDARGTTFEFTWHPEGPTHGSNIPA